MWSSRLERGRACPWSLRSHRTSPSRRFPRLTNEQLRCADYAAVVQSQHRHGLVRELVGSLVYDSGFPSIMETAVNPGSNPGGRTTFRQMFRTIRAATLMIQ